MLQDPDWKVEDQRGAGARISVAMCAEETNVILHRVKLTGDTPAHCKPVDSMLEMLVLRALTSPYASPIVMVKKKDGSNRVCADFRKLNKITKVDPEPTTTAEICSISSVARNTCSRSI